MGELSAPEFYISKRVGKAITDYDLLHDGDRIAVAVSGGKDSLTLLKVLKDRQRFVPVKYELLALHVDLGYPSSHAKVLERYFRKIGVRFHIEPSDALRGMKAKDISCFWCSWNRRKALFQAAYRLGYPKVALGHHFDDIIETILMNLFFNGEISAMAPKQELFKGKITLIRPLAYAEERMITRFAKEAAFPKLACRCPHSSASNRQAMADIIAGLEKTCRDVKKNIFRGVKRINKDYLL